MYTRLSEAALEGDDLIQVLGGMGLNPAHLHSSPHPTDVPSPDPPLELQSLESGVSGQTVTGP